MVAQMLGAMSKRRPVLDLKMPLLLLP